MIIATTGRVNLGIVERRSRVASMRKAGATLAEIGRAVGASTATVHRDVEAVLGDLHSQSVDQIAEWRARKLGRYAMKMAIIDEAIADAIEAGQSDRIAPLVSAWVKVDTAESRLLGTDMPARHVVAATVQPMTEEEAQAIIAEMEAFEGR